MTRTASSVPSEIGTVFNRYSPEVARALNSMRALVFEVAEAEQIGALEESLKWGQPAYRPKRPKTGSTLRMDGIAGEPGRYALYFHCQTNLVETFRDHYPDILRFEGNRAVLFDASDDLPERAVRHCIALALTYHRRKLAA